jgi:hypothetical protein
MAKWLVTGLLLLAVFGAGYMVGGREQRSVQQNLQQLKDEMARRTLELERHVTSARMRGHLLEMRDALTTAQTHIEHQDFGMTRRALADAQRSFQSALRLDESGALSRLRPIEQELTQLQTGARPLGAPAIKTIERIKQQIIQRDDSR